MPVLPALVPARLQNLRASDGCARLATVLIPSSDPHLSEYLPAPHWQGREWFSGFTGSSGDPDRGRQPGCAVYRQSLLGTNRGGTVRHPSGSVRSWKALPFQPMCIGCSCKPAQASWLVDGAVLGLAQTQQLQQALSAAQWTLVATEDPLAAVWAERPALPSATVFEHVAPTPPPRAPKSSQP